MARRCVWATALLVALLSLLLPAALAHASNPVTWGPITVSQVHLGIVGQAGDDGGDRAFVPPGSAVRMRFHWQTADPSYQQIQIGFSQGRPSTCVPIPAGASSGDAAVTFTAPTAIATYHVGFDHAPAACDPSNPGDWANDPPGSSRWIAAVHVTNATDHVVPQVYLVTNTNDSGDGSLRAAIEAANGHAGQDGIAFEIAANGVAKITPLSPLPAISGPVIIDGYTQPGAALNTSTDGDNAKLLVELSGAQLASGDGLALKTSDSLIQGLIIDGFPGAGVSVASGAGNSIRGNRIYANQGLGIDLGGDGLTFNHLGSISGPNNYQNYPVLVLATSDGTRTRLKGTLDSAPNSAFQIEVFSNPVCDGTTFGPGQTTLGTFSVTTGADGRAAFERDLLAGLAEGQGVSATATDGGGNTSEFAWCRPVSTTNVNWMAAQAVSGSVQQRITGLWQEKWFRFPAQPGARVHLKYSGLPGSAISLHRDPNPIYNDLRAPQDPAALSAETADSAFLPSGSLPSGSLPSGSLPSGSLPYESLPSGSLPTGYLPSGSLPSGSLPSGSLPSGSLPSGSLPSGSLPSGSLPSGSLPSGSLPSGSLPSGSLPSGSLPSGSLPAGASAEAYSGAALRSLIAIAMDPYASVQTIDRDTYDLFGDLYVRVVGPYSPGTPFTLEVSVEAGVCAGIAPVPSGVPAIASPAPAPTTHKTLILTNSARIPGTSSQLTDALQRLATYGDVDGVVIDFAQPGYGRVAEAMSQSDAHPTCPAAKNLLASEIRDVIQAYRAASGTTLQYIVLAGSADVIPYFQVKDWAGLANEKEYVPPVKPLTPSEAGLMMGLVQGQDAYGARTSILRGDHRFYVPDLAVGRLVESASDIITAVDEYIAANGVVAPDSALVTGYDFVGDAAAAIKMEVEAAINPAGCASTAQGCKPAEALIQRPGLPPGDASAWHADDLRARLLAGGHGFVALTGHFSAGNLLAADYATSMAATEVSAAPTGFANTVVVALGCHSGYTLPGVDLFSGLSPSPDWAKAFLGRRAAAFVAATGYAYGDTELVEYGERLAVEFTRQLRTGSGPVAIGQALVAAKQRYLAGTAQMTGIDEKTLVETTLYGLPMMRVDFGGQRLPAPSEPSIVAATLRVPDGPGAALGLRLGQPAGGSGDGLITIRPSLAEAKLSLRTLPDGPTVVASYLFGKDGQVTNPYEPIFPKELYNLDVDGVVLRGVALRGASFSDTPGVVPLTGAPGTETSVAHLSFNSSVFYPNQTWLANYFDAIGGGPPRLIAVPAQFKSSALGAIDGTRRQYSSLQFYAYYLASNWTSDPALRAAGVAAAPSIVGASAVISDTAQDGKRLIFSANVLGEAAAGIQAVWVLYTASGQWRPLDLAQPDAALAPTLWQGSLPLPDNVQDLRFMVQAVSGAGLTALATNNGAYYAVGPSTPPPAGAQTALALQLPGASATYLRPSAFGLRLTYLDRFGAAQPLPGQNVTLSLGGQTAWATTDGDGRAAVTLSPVVLPGTYGVQSAFGGAMGYRSASAAGTIEVVKDKTALSLAPQAPVRQCGQVSPVVARLHDSAGRALGAKSVIFVVNGSGGSLVRSVIADYVGNAPLGKVALPAGAYTVDAYFATQVLLGNDPLVTLSDPYYHGAHVSGSMVINAPPAIGEVAGPAGPSPINTTVTVAASFTDDSSESPAATWTWGDGSSTPGSVGGSGDARSVTGSHSYTTPGVYAVTLKVTDECGASAYAAFEYVVIYDPSGGYVTGGGWINSPAGAYAADPSLTGEAQFGFVARYQKGATAPGGNTQFQFVAGDLKFRSIAYEWLVVSGAKAQFKGSGTINGAGSYSFLLTAVDGQVAGGGGADTFRIKIWNEQGVVYDNMMGKADSDGPTTVLGGGSIQIHS